MFFEIVLVGIWEMCYDSCQQYFVTSDNSAIGGQNSAIEGQDSAIENQDLMIETEKLTIAHDSRINDENAVQSIE